MQNKIQIFEKRPVRAIWDEENEKQRHCGFDPQLPRDVLLGEYIGTNCPHVEMKTEIKEPSKNNHVKNLILKRTLSSRNVPDSFSLIPLLNKGIREKLRYVLYATKVTFINKGFPKLQWLLPDNPFEENRIIFVNR